jgi:micrococcal nuclease
VELIIDGDTIDVLIGNEIFRVRYIGINTPETVDLSKPAEYFGTEASSKNKELVGGKTVYLEKDTLEADNNSRLLRYVYVDGLFVNEELVKQGYAYATPYPPDITYESLFESDQEKAISEKKGLWAKVQFAFIGNKNSMIYHYYYCDSVKDMSEKNKVPFNSSKEAKAVGYSPCKICHSP